MKEDRPSITAAFVAACRSFGVLLPEGERLIDDPYGARFARAMGLFRVPWLARAVLPRRALGYMQVRTRVIDDALLAFARAGGRQVVILGAGFDCRALRFARELGRATVFEVDHPATQGRKREVLRGDVGAKTEYLAWDFEARPMSELPSALAELGHDAQKPTFTIWEGVTPYLSETAIDSTLAAVRDYSASASRLAFTYMDRAFIDSPRLAVRLGQRLVAWIGEPFRFGWDPRALPEWMKGRGFRIDRDAGMTELARELGVSGLENADDRHIALATRQVT